MWPLQLNSSVGAAGIEARLASAVLGGETESNDIEVMVEAAVRRRERRAGRGPVEQ